MKTLRYFYHSDHLGSTSWVTDSAKNGVQYCEYLPYGEPFIDQRSTTWSSRYTFSGKERDSETGYSYFGARYYHSDLSVWLSVDPMSDKYPNLTPYAYCANNPMKFVDPNGRMTTVALGDNDGDFYDRQGNYLGTDGVNDGKVYVLNKGFRAKTENTNVNWGGTLSDKHIKALKSKSEEITMDSDLGNMMRTVYAEMRGGDDNAKAIVAESIYNRSKLSSGYEKADGTYTGIVNKFYDVTKSGNATNNVFSNPTDYIYKNSTETDAWRSSVRASLKAHFGLSDVGKGVIFYNSASSTYYDKNPKMIKISLDVTHKGVKGLWKLK